MLCPHNLGVSAGRAVRFVSMVAINFHGDRAIVALGLIFMAPDQKEK